MGLASLLRPLVGRIHEADGGDFVTTVTGLEQLGFQVGHELMGHTLLAKDRKGDQEGYGTGVVLPKQGICLAAGL
ncbi:subunit of exocyst complex 8 [Perilla frutescens var. hirtella]|nr:subunit of exocyst complex 8 [Perilla frutescens var. hirtella]